MTPIKSLLSSLTPQNYHSLSFTQAQDILNYLLSSHRLYQFIPCSKGLKVGAWEVMDDSTGKVYPELRFEY